VSTAKVISADQLFADLDEADLRILDATAFLKREIEGGPYVVASGRATFEAAHIPGAVFADIPGALSKQDSPFPFTLPTAEHFATAMGALGVGPNTRVVAYAQESPMWATRLWWLLRYFGFEYVEVLDGGLMSWIEAGYETSSAPAVHPTAAFHAVERRELLATKDDILLTLGGEPACLLNALPPKAFRGEGPGAYSRPGRIPGSLSIPSIKLLVTPLGPFRPVAELTEELADVVNAHEGVPVIAYCGGGISATIDIFALSLLGIDDVLLYDGSLTEWSADPALPLEVG
jgi:thiosulfate/3-mercaptopyruvate sulfurtransferase